MWQLYHITKHAISYLNTCLSKSNNVPSSVPWNRSSIEAATEQYRRQWWLYNSSMRVINLLAWQRKSLITNHNYVLGNCKYAVRIIEIHIKTDKSSGQSFNSKPTAVYIKQGNKKIKLRDNYRDLIEVWCQCNYTPSHLDNYIYNPICCLLKLRLNSQDFYGNRWH